MCSSSSARHGLGSKGSTVPPLASCALACHAAVAALLRAGLDVLHTDATAVFVRDFVPQLHGAPRDAYDVLVQRDAWPANPMRKVGTATNAGFYYVRADKDGAVARLVMAAVERGLIEFYLRWNNIPDQARAGGACVPSSPARARHTGAWAAATTQPCLLAAQGSPPRPRAALRPLPL